MVTYFGRAPIIQMVTSCFTFCHMMYNGTLYLHNNAKKFKLVLYESEPAQLIPRK